MSASAVRRKCVRLVSSLPFLPLALFFVFGCSLARPRVLPAQGLKVTYGAKGVQSLSYGGAVLEDLNTWGGDAFHIWHVKCTDLQGNVLSSGQFGWGENNNGESWNAATNTETYTFRWGTISAQFVQQGDNLNITVTETNNAGSGIILSGAEIYPFALHFPQDPAGFSGYSQYVVTTTGPGVSAADYGTGVVTLVIPNEAMALYGGWKVAGSKTYTPVMTGTAPDGLATFLPHNDLPVKPGTSLSYTVSLRFTPERTAASAADAYSSFAATYPSQMTWTDKRILGTAYLASSPSGADVTQPGGFPTNPRRYFNDPSVDVTTAAGLQAFQRRVLAQAAASVTNTQAMNGQGVVTWDIEGEQYPQTTSYVCSPDQIASVAPEMESIVTIPGSAFLGQKLVDAYFKTMTSAGLKVGVCLRPQVFTPGQNGTAQQVYLSSNGAIVSTLETKAKYANLRWGATIFYIDSTVDSNGGTLDPAIFQQLITDLPGFLFIPEESTPRYYAYSAPFASFIFHQSTGTPASMYNVYPKAFSATLVNDVAASVLSSFLPQLTQAVSRGDILMGHADYWQANDPTLISIYQAAGASGTKPAQVTPVINWPAPPAITYGTSLSATQLNATTNAPGIFTYTPAAGSILNAGTTSLLTTFTPADNTAYSAATASVSLTVGKATPGLSWTAPASVSYGTPLSGAQLNTAASVPGTLTYSPAAGTILPAGTNRLSVTFAPADATNYSSAAATVPFSVSRASPVLKWNTPLPITDGTALSSLQLNATASVPGSFSYTPPSGMALHAGTYALQVAFVPSDSVDYATATASVPLTVTPAKQLTPSIFWSAPAAIAYGTPLSDVQLNATSSVPGTFSYNPAAGRILSAGTSVLNVTFTPADSKTYQGVSSATNLTVSRAAPVIQWPQPSPVNYGTPLTSAQLNPVANTAGTFTFAPPAGSVLSVGAWLLTATFVPNDSANYSAQTSSVSLTVSPPVQNSRLYIVTPAAGTALSGAIIVSAQCTLPLDAAGTFLMVDGVGVGTRRVTERPFLYALDTTTLVNGTHVLQVWAHDIGNNTTISDPVAITVAN